MTLSTSPQGVVLLRNALEHGVVLALLREADRIYDQIGSLIQAKGPDAATLTLPLPHRYLPQASSLSLGAVCDQARVDVLLTGLSRGGVIQLIEKQLEGEVVCDLDQAWVRRQYAPHRYPPGHAPHGWHQDGALGFDFLALGNKPPGPDALLPLVTCWIALTPCGLDAPGLEFLARRTADLHPVTALTDTAVRSQFAEELFWRPRMQAGDAVLFPGGTLHRTHVTSVMVEDRTSVELRFLARENIPLRLAGDHFLELPSAHQGNGK